MDKYYSNYAKKWALGAKVKNSSGIALYVKSNCEIFKLLSCNVHDETTVAKFNRADGTDYNFIVFPNESDIDRTNALFEQYKIKEQEL